MFTHAHCAALVNARLAARMAGPAVHSFTTGANRNQQFNIWQNTESGAEADFRGRKAPRVVGICGRWGRGPVPSAQLPRVPTLTQLSHARRLALRPTRGRLAPTPPALSPSLPIPHKHLLTSFSLYKMECTSGVVFRYVEDQGNFIHRSFFEF